MNKLLYAEHLKHHSKCPLNTSPVSTTIIRPNGLQATHSFSVLDLRPQPCGTQTGVSPEEERAWKGWVLWPPRATGSRGVVHWDGLPCPKSACSQEEQHKYSDPGHDQWL